MQLKAGKRWTRYSICVHWAPIADRQGKRYEYTHAQRQQDLEWCLTACRRYQERIQQGFSEEHARGLIPFDVRQHWVLSANVRSLMHLLDLRWKTRRSTRSSETL